MTVIQWFKKCFPGQSKYNTKERAARFIEEAFELCQAAGIEKIVIFRLLEYVYSRPPGKLAQEVGGTMVTLKLFAWSLGLSADKEFRNELHRISAPATMEMIRLKQEEKKKAGVAS